VATGSQEVSETSEDLRRMTERFKVERDDDSPSRTLALSSGRRS
jgi:hypothetical protein